jgi:hypothetical protein
VETQFLFLGAALLLLLLHTSTVVVSKTYETGDSNSLLFFSREFTWQQDMGLETTKANTTFNTTPFIISFVSFN